MATDPIEGVIVETHPAGGGQGDDGASADWVRLHQPYADWLNLGGSSADGRSRTEQRPPSANAHSAHHCCGPRLLVTVSTHPRAHDAQRLPAVGADRRKVRGRYRPSTATMSTDSVRTMRTAPVPPHPSGGATAGPAASRRRIAPGSDRTSGGASAPGGPTLPKEHPYVQQPLRWKSDV